VGEPQQPALRLGAIILAGGTAVRMDGADKAVIELDGVTLLERVLAATMSAIEVVVVGEQVPTSRPVTWTREDPQGGGPAAGLLAGLDRFLVAPDLVAVLAVDMPKVNAGTVARLTWVVEGDSSYDGAVLEDQDGRVQPLCGVYRTASLQRVRPESLEEEYGLPVRTLISHLILAHVPSVGDEARDVDTWEDLTDLRTQ